MRTHWRTPVSLFLLALLARLVLIAVFPDPAYPDSSYYVEVARAIAGGHGLNVDFIWIFAEVGNRIPDVPTLPIPSNAHWLPLASLVQVPFIALLGPTAFASALPLALIGSLAAPLTWAIARDARAQSIVAVTAGVLSAVPAAATVFMAQPENFAILQPLVAGAIWCTARGLKGSSRSYVFAGLLAGLAALARNDGVFLGAAIGLVWFGDRVRWWRGRRGRGSWVHVDDRRPISLAAAVGCLVLFLLVMGPWWARQLAVFGSISPTSSSGAALWIRSISEWNSITAHPSLQQFLAQGWGVIIASRLAGLWAAIGSYVVVIGSLVLAPFTLLGAIGRARSRDFAPWFVYLGIVFLTAALVYPLHVPGGSFVHSAIGLAPHAAILSMEGVLILVRAIASRRRTWDELGAARVLTWAVVGLVVATAVVFGGPVTAGWDETRQPRIQLATELDRLSVPSTDRVMSIDAAGMKYWTGRPGVVSPDDPIETIETVARAYNIRWLV
ncbi:MAG: glycosyltransferase family 39 protein, partial [Anaerolineaceae bacterium]